ncbi:MAG: FG-GAP repeat domain-containing protein, partial [Marinicellaceae bacterium]
MRKLILISLLLSQPILAWNFIEKSLEVGLAYEHNYGDSVIVKEPHIIAGGLAIGDVNGDGWDDIFAVTGEILDNNSMNSNPNKLFIAQQDGTYIEQSSDFGLNTTDSRNAGPLIADLNGDGLRDLIFGSIDQDLDPELKLYVNSNNSSFISVNHTFYPSETYSISAADTDKDGDLDLLQSHWLNDTEHNYWLNNGDGTFIDVTTTHLNISPIANSFTSIFADINNDNHDDLLLTNDFGTSVYFKNNLDGTMTYSNTDVINDENGMGAAVGDYDNDGDLDWFASSIYDSDGISEGNWGVSGNRLYQ